MKPAIPRRFTMRILRIGLVVVKNEDKVLLGFCKWGFNKNKFSLLGGVLQPREEMEASILKYVQFILIIHISLISSYKAKLTYLMQHSK